MTDIHGQGALVTGGGSGIGRGLALELAKEGASVAIADIRQDMAQAVAEEVIGRGGRAMSIACDVSDRSSVQAMKGAVNQALGPVSLLFANAGVTYCKPMQEISEAALDWVTAVNFLGPLNCVQAFLPDMVEAGVGHIVATSSMAALTPTLLPYYVPYTAAKAGIIGLIFNLAAELAGSGVQCTLLCPGGVKTRMVESLKARPDRFGGPSDEMIVHVSKRTFDSANLQFREADEVARIVLDAVRKNSPVVLTDSSQRDLFLESFVRPFLSAFDAAEDFDNNKSTVQ